ncbi:sulfurtransferase [Tepidibacter aestuarii]|uniref:sulfurtransferase n=1 Tax=Tepidibacter aestuarii TaxID=2925782 RepID=UPI0020BE6C4A|nr:rhodanese-like domain-containing protein [Tepidibacter aestuarii]CAH2212478.1 protein of unknown function [Tepidibacter aestuarii]
MEKIYEEDHIKNAFYLDMNNDLSGERKKHGGFRPIPDLNLFKEKLENIGVNNHTTIVIYDEYLDGAPRLWWLLKYLGYDKTYVLNGGTQEWKKQGYPITKEIHKVEKQGKYSIKINKDIYCYIDYVKSRKADDNIVLIDSRAYERYLGENEPLYATAGHIPSATNYPWQNNIKNNFFKEKESLKKDLD